jgi:acyl-[acyl-carrier-protein]-phospholipid O-acyltransferase/long-chain-fatty-acid--[acyl-carrier-protein] ligase
MTLHVRFIHNAKRLGGKLAYIDRTTGRRITYSQALIASLILKKKFRKYDKGFLGIMLPTSAGCALSTLGALMSDRVPVMINYSGEAERNARYAQKKCDFRTIITSRALLEKISCPEVSGMVFIEDIMEGITKAEKLKAFARSKLPATVLANTVHKGSLDDNLVILFTSGSEKDPKAVQLTQRNISSNIEGISESLGLCEDDSFIANLPFFHVFGLTANLWAPLYHGMTTISYASPIEYKTICDIVREERPTLMVGTPAFFWGYLRKSEPGDFDSLRIMLVGADKCPDALRKAFMEKHGKVLYEAYGATETSPAISGNYEGSNKPGSVGRPFKGVQVRIEHYETGEDCAPGEVGRILVRGDNVMLGYFNDFEETALHLRHGWYDTGDMGYMDEDGFLWHVGRFRRFVKIGGEMVSLVRVENAIEDIVEEGIECCVVEVPDAIKGSRIVAALTKEIDRKAMSKALGKVLPNIALPRDYVVIDEFPKMGSGKIDFRTTTDMVIDLLKKSQ